MSNHPKQGSTTDRRSHSGAVPAAVAQHVSVAFPIPTPAVAVRAVRLLTSEGT